MDPIPSTSPPRASSPLMVCEDTGGSGLLHICRILGQWSRSPRRSCVSRIVWATLLVSTTRVLAQEADPTADPDVVPAQFTQSAGPFTASVADPPAPVVRVQVRVPSHAAPGKDVTYRVYVTNTSAADAHRVVVRNPIPAGVAQVVTAEPKPDKTDPKEIAWTIGRLPAGEKREFELTLRPDATAKEIRNQAFVAFEYGQAVVTSVDRPKLQVRTVAPKDAVAGEPFAVRVEVVNAGRVSVTSAELVENVGKGAEFASGDGGEKGATAGQRVWKLGTLRPGERKYVDFRLTSKDGGDLLTRAVVRSAETPDGEPAEATTKILVPGLAVDLTGPTTVPAGEVGTFEVVARNTGTLPLTNVRVTAAVPSDTTVAKMTNGGQVGREIVAWIVPRLDAGDARSFRVGLKGGASGNRTVKAVARDARGLEKSRELATAFQGSAVLHMRTVPEPVILSVGRNGLITVQVTNQGTDAAKNVRLRIELPPQVRFVEGSPKYYQASVNEVAFDAVTVAAGRSETFTVTYRADRAEQASFRIRLSSDSLGDRPLTKDQSVEITGGS